jgi:hypothetical protein
LIMANRHRAQARAAGGRTFYAGGGSEAAKAVTAKHGFAKGGKADMGRATGGRAKGRGDFARGGRASGGSVMSSAHGSLGGSGGHAGAANAKRGGKFAKGGKVELAKGGKVPAGGAFRRGGKAKECAGDDEEEDGGDDEEEEDSRYARGGRMHYGSEPERDPDGMKYKGERHHRVDGGRNWIAGAIKHPGALHKSLGVPQGEKIPAKKLAKAEHSDNPTTARRAKLAEILKGFH